MAGHATRRLGKRRDGLRVNPVGGDVGLHEAHRRFGGRAVPASRAGTLTRAAGMLCGKLGDRCHRGADQLITASRPGGVGGADLPRPDEGSS